MTSFMGRVVVIADADAPQARTVADSLAARGAHVVLVGHDAAALGELAASVRDARGARVAVFVGEPSDPALAEMVAELFPDGPTRPGS